MCGDGANDCGALKAANVGVSLSEAEASVASPFTSQERNISCILLVIREGRAALVTSFGIFKFMILYSFTEFFSTLFLYRIDTNLTDFQFLFIDVFLIVNFAFLFGRSEAFKGPIVSQTPPSTLLGIIPITSMLLQVIMVVFFQVLSLYLVKQFSWFEPFHYTDVKHYASYENYAVYTISQFQYIAMAVTFSQSHPYRERLSKNTWFFLSIIIMVALSVYITVYPADWVIKLLEFRFPPNTDFPWVIVGLAVAVFVISLFFEMFVVNYLFERKFKFGLRSLARIKLISGTP